MTDRLKDTVWGKGSWTFDNKTEKRIPGGELVKTVVKHQRSGKGMPS